MLLPICSMDDETSSPAEACSEAPSARLCAPVESCSAPLARFMEDVFTMVTTSAILSIVRFIESSNLPSSSFLALRAIVSSFDRSPSASLSMRCMAVVMGREKRFEKMIARLRASMVVTTSVPRMKMCPWMAIFSMVRGAAMNSASYEPAPIIQSLGAK